jgi:ElaB/YqjD/DUF883 family membrane-anchored ribosome-binding protein
MSNSTAKSKSGAPSIDRAANSAQHLRELAKDAKASLTRNGASAAKKVQSLGERLRDGKTAAVTQVKRAAKAVRTQAARVDKTIRAKPYQSLGVAAGAGLVAGYLISRRRSSAS